MARSLEYEARIQKYGWGELRNLWARIEGAETAPEWNPGKAFEYLVLRAFQLDHAEVQWPYDVPWEGNMLEHIDGVVHLHGHSFLVESKDREQDVSIEAIAKLRNQLVRRPPGTLGVVFSRRGFTNPARLLLQFTSPQNVLLWPGHELNYALEKERISSLLVLKYRRCVELALPDYDVRHGEIT